MAVGALGALGAIGSIAGSAVGLVGSLMDSKAAKKQEKLRQAQMQLEQRRARRESIRRGAVQRARALSLGVNAGAGTQSSPVIGAQQTIQGQADREVGGSFQNEDFGNRMFSLNRRRTNAQTISNLGGAFSNLFSSIG